MPGPSKKPSYWEDIIIPDVSISFDIGAFDRLIASHGVTYTHYKAIRCPIGLTDPFDVHSHANHDDCSNGMLYRRAGDLIVYVQNNQSVAVFDDIGVMDGSTVQATFSRFYDDSDKEVSVQPYDRFFLTDQAAVSHTTQYFEHNQAGYDKVQYPILAVEYLMDSRGNEYFESQDFVIVAGQIKWLGQRQPGFDPKLDKGDICSIRYSYRAYWYLKQLLHEVRVSRDINPVTGELELVRCPHSAILTREYVFENERNDENITGQKDPRDVRAPRKRGLGPR